MYPQTVPISQISIFCLQLLFGCLLLYVLQGSTIQCIYYGTHYIFLNYTIPILGTACLEV